MPDQIQSTTISKSAVDRAGEVLRAASVDQTKRDDALRIMSSWRSRHVYVINTFQATLRKRLGGIDSYGLVAQRLKRSTSIIAKLQRLNNMKLSRMQDIGGIRAVVDRLGQIDQLRGLYEDVGRLDHKLLAIDDYITNPKKDGYRSVHLIFRYHSPELPHCNGLLLELQFRTKLQHAWATAVETMGTFLGQSLKARQGESHWQQFFELTSAAISHVEKSPVLSNWSGLDFESTCVAIRDAELQIGVLDKLQGFSLVVDAVSAEGRRSSKYHLVILDSLKKQVSIQSYSEIEFSSANEAYEAAESRAIYGEPIEVYLVSAGTLDVLRKAYPNFFLDTDAFVRAVKRFIKTGDSVKRLGRRRKFLVKRGQGYLDF